MSAFKVQAEPLRVNIGVLEFPPFSYFERDGKTLTGGVIELIRQAFAEVSYEVDFTALPYARAVALAEEGALDGCGMLNAGTSTVLQLSHQPITQLVQTFYVRASDNWTFDAVDSLKGRRAVTVSSYNYRAISPSYQDFLERDTNVTMISSSSDYLERIIKMITSGRVDLFNESRVVMEHKLEKLKMIGRLKPAGVLGAPLAIYLGFRPGLEGSQMRDRFNQGWVKLRDSGELDTIMAQFGMGSN